MGFLSFAFRVVGGGDGFRVVGGRDGLWSLFAVGFLGWRSAGLSWLFICSGDVVGLLLMMVSFGEGKGWGFLSFWVLSDGISWVRLCCM